MKVKTASRILNPGSWLAAATLALGIAGSTAIFSFLEPLLIHPLAYSNPEQLVTIQPRDPKGNPTRASYPDFRDWSQQNSTIADIAAFDIGFFDLTRVNEPEEVPGALVTPNLFHLLGVSPAFGRDFGKNDEAVVILTDAAWKRRFAADPNILGRTIDLDFARTPQIERFTVIGVMPPNFWMYYGNFEVFVPLTGNVIRDDRHARLLTVIARLAPHATPQQAESALKAIPIEKNWTVEVRSWQDEVRRPIRAQLLTLAAGATLLLLIASANVAGLLLVRAHARRREMAIRAALGASPARLVRLFLVDSLRPGAAAAILGIALAFACVKLMTALLPPDIELTRMLPGVGHISVDPPAVAFACIVGMAACLAAAVVPALRIRHATLRDLAALPPHRTLLVITEVALAFMLLSGAGLLLKTLDRIRSIDLGFRPENILALRVPPPRANVNASYYNELTARIAALPGVRSAALMSSITGRPRPGFEIRGQKLTADELIVDPPYFETLGIPLRRGRFFDNSDRRRIVINQTMASRYWPKEDPIGQSILLDNQPLEIVGIAADTRPQPFLDPTPLVYRSLRDPGAHAAQMVIRTSADPLTLARAVTETVRDLGGVVAEAGSMQHFIENQTWQQQQAAALMAAFAALALVLAAIGLYSVISFAVARRTREIGIRIALGARPSNVIALVLAESAKPVLIGIALGLVASLAVTRVLATLLYQVAPNDPTILTAVTASIAITTLLATLRPLARALAIDPNSALRNEC